MKKTQLWIEIVMFATGMACGVALFLACLAAVAGVAGEFPAPQAVAAELQPPSVLQSSPAVQPAADPQQAYEGMVTCSQCGARHSAKSGKTAAECSRACFFKGAQFTLVEGETTYLLDGDVALVKKFAGQRARIVGALKGNTIIVSAVAAT